MRDSIENTTDMSGESWDAVTHLLFDVGGVDGNAPTGELLASFRIGSLIAGHVKGGAQSFTRDAGVIARGGGGWILIQYYVEGGFSGTTSAGQIDVFPGDISCLDLAQSFATVARRPLENINILVPRQLWLSRSPGGRIPHGQVLRAEGACTKIVQATLAKFMLEAPRLEPHERVALSVAVVDLLAGSFSARTPVEAVSAPASTHRVRDYLDAHMADEQLTVESVCSALGVSRASLYRAAAPLGGIATYVREERLRHAFNSLRSVARGAGRVSMTSIAKECGFANEATFARLFKTNYGVSPTEAARRAELAARTPPNDHIITRWLMEEQAQLPPA
mgnify:CR=1 FL=1